MGNLLFLNSFVADKIIKVPNSNGISCSNCSLLECSPVTQVARVRFPAETCLSRSALVEDEQNSLHKIVI